MDDPANAQFADAVLNRPANPRSVGRTAMSPPPPSPGIAPLPPLAYPRVVEQTTRGVMYFVVLGVVCFVWAMTPGAYIYLAWYLYTGQYSSPALSLSHVVALVSVVEVIFSLYLRVLARQIQPPAPPTTMKPDELSDMFLHVILAGVAYTPSATGRARAVSAASVPAAIARERRRSMTVSVGAVETEDQRMEGAEAVAAATARKLRVGLASPQVKIRRRNGLENGNGRAVGFGLASPRTPTSLRGGNGSALDELYQDEEEAEDYLSVHHHEPVDPEHDDVVDPLFDKDGKPRVLDQDDPRAVEFREHLRTWFNHAPWSAIKRDDMILWLCWSAFNMDPVDVAQDAKKQRFLTRTFDMLEARTGTKFAEGSGGLKVLRLTLDTVNVVSRPWWIYAIANSVNWVLRDWWYPSRGVQRHRMGGIDYLVRIPPGWTPEKGRTERNAMPVVYLHGLGFGLLQNHLLIKHLVHSLPTHPILVPLAYHTAHVISNPRFLKPWTRPELVKSISETCQHFGFWEPPLGRTPALGGVSMMSHSNGSVHHAWVLKDCPSITRRNTFVDPVVFSLWEGDVCFNFCYRTPRTPLQLLLYYFVASEVGIANYIQRHFNWCDNTLFIEEIPHATDSTRTAFFIGGEDVIIDAKRTRLYLERNGVSAGLHWDEKAGHGDGLIGAARDRVVMMVGTGSTRGWQGWLTRGRRSHSLGRDDAPVPE